MKKIILIACLSLFICRTQVSAQTTTGSFDNVPYIEVNGNAEKEVLPDEIYIGIIIVENKSKESQSVEKQEEKLKEMVKSLGLDLSDLYLSDTKSNYVKVIWKKKEVDARKEYTLKVKDAATVAKVFQELEKMDVNYAYILKVDHSKMDSLTKAVKIEAIKDAKEKADYLLEAIGEKAGKPLIVKELEKINLPDYNNIYKDYYSIKGSRTDATVTYIEGTKMSDNTEIQFQKIKIESNIYVKFSVK